MLEEDVSVFSTSAKYGMLGIQSSGAESGHGVFIDHFIEHVVVPDLDLLDLVRSTESVEEVDERHSAFDRGQVGNGAEVHYFLRIGFGKHRITGLTACVNVRMVSENVKGVGGNASCGNVDNVRKKFARDLVHVRDHQEQAL